MSKKSNKGFIARAKGSIFHSLNELGKACGCEEPAMNERTKKCRECGKTMNHVDGTNVYICPDCGKRLLQRSQPSPTTLI